MWGHKLLCYRFMLLPWLSQFTHFLHSFCDLVCEHGCYIIVFYLSKVLVLTENSCLLYNFPWGHISDFFLISLCQDICLERSKVGHLKSKNKITWLMTSHHKTVSESFLCWSFSQDWNLKLHGIKNTAI